MTVSSVLYLFLTHLAIGIAASLLTVDREAGIKFFRFNAGLAVVLLVVALAFLPPELSGWGEAGRWAQALVGLATVVLFVYWVTIGRALSRHRSKLLATASAAGGAALVVQALGVSAAQPVGWQALTVASVLSSAALLGGACTAMILGHWYLVLPSMEVRHLQAIVKLHIGSTVVRTAVVALAVWLAIASWEPGAGPSFLRYITSVAGVFFWQRVLFGLVGPMVLAYLTWETAKIRSTQSATGILYVDFFTVIVGEILAVYLLLSTSVPV